jgi:glycosyltransferase involved in cell wall biosynthesis
VFRDTFRSARGLVFQTYAEARFVNRLFGTAATRQLVLGLGSDPQPGDPAQARATVGLGDRPFLLSVGRVDDGKGTGALARFFAAYKAQRPGPLALVLAGPVVHPPVEHADIIVPGVVDEATKWGLLRDALAFVNPSGFEAFSLVLVEAWHAARPVLVNRRSFATSEHCERSGGGFAFDDFASFGEAVDRLMGDDALRRALGAAGQRYVETQFTWPAILARYRAFLEAVLAHRV